MFDSFFKLVADNFDEIENEFSKMTLTVQDCKAFLCFDETERKRGVITGTSDFFQGLLAIPSLGVSLIGDRPTLNNNMSSTITLVGEISRINSKLGYSCSDHWRAKEIERNYLQEVPAKETCRVM